MEKLTQQQITAQIEALTIKLAKCSQAYNSRNLKTTVITTAIDKNTGRTFNHAFDCTDQDADLMQFFNMYAATLAAERLALYEQLRKVVQS